MKIFKEFRFEAAHFLPSVPETHKCGRLHGHSYLIRIYVKGPIDDTTGWVCDFAHIKKEFNPILEQLDHRFLNEIPGLENPTSENLARWIWQKLKPELPSLSKIAIQETQSSGCEYKG